MLPGRGSATGRNFLAPPYYSQRVVFASPPSAFFIACGKQMSINICVYARLNLNRQKAPRLTFLRFYRVSACYAGIARYFFYQFRLPVCLSIRPITILRINEWTYRYTFNILIGASF